MSYDPEYNRQYRERNQDRIREYNREYRNKNRGEINKKNREYRQRNRDVTQAYYLRNRDKLREKNRRYREQNSEYIRALGLRYMHGIQPEAWAAMWAAQNGCCYLCGRPLSAAKKQVHVDHDHRCCAKGSCQFCRRGLACNDCNIAIGMAGDDPSRLRRMADALERAQAEVAERMAAKPIQDELGA